jgi:eukaryotic translation initiation factor 2C
MALGWEQACMVRFCSPTSLLYHLSPPRSSTKCPEQRFHVDLDAEKGRDPRPGKDADVCYVKIVMTKSIRLELIHAYLAKKAEMDDQVFEVISKPAAYLSRCIDQFANSYVAFFDHCMRQGPSQQFIGIKRSFFPTTLRQVNLDSVVMALKGVYASMRMCDVSTTPTGLAVNVDVANATFWIAQEVHQVVRNLLSKGDRTFDYNAMRFALQPQQMGLRRWTSNEAFKLLRVMQKLKFTCKYDST